jgi:hypothetical protein
LHGSIHITDPESATLLHFQAKGLRADAVCPCAASAEGLTVSLRRPGREGVNATGRGVLSMAGLSFGVVRVDQENSLTSLTLQDCGQVIVGNKKTRPKKPKKTTLKKPLKLFFCFFFNF